MSSLVKLSTIIEVINSRPITYKVKLESSLILKLLHTQITPRPPVALSVGDCLRIYEVNGSVKWASVDSGEDSDDHQETVIKDVRITHLDRNNSHVILLDANGEGHRVRVPAGHSLWGKIYVGQSLQIEISHPAGGNTKYQFIFPSSGAASSREKDVPSSGHKRTGSEEQASQYAVDKIGIDSVYFHEREKEGHRYEIMAFLAEHLHDDLIEWYQIRQAINARFLSPTKPLQPAVERALRSVDENFGQLYNHQARALDSIRARRNLVVVTQTASGKTLCYNPAIFEHIVANDPSAHALYVFPLNALMVDQKEKIDQLRQSFGAQGFSINADLLIGGLGAERHNIARANPQIMATNPEMLSVMLNEPQKWQYFFSNLKYVVVDEVHTYRGILGLHMAGILRRLLLQTRRLGCEPQFILSSATVNNPMDLAVRLTSLSGESFDILGEEDDGSAQASKHWTVVNPDALAKENTYDNYLTTAAMTMLELLNARNVRGEHSALNTIVFAKSNRDVNKIHKIIQDNLRHYPHLQNKVRKYIAAELTPSQKREAYDGLKSGQILGMVSTNALGAGIDIGKLDVCIIAGFPFSVMDMRQMAGRVGRRDEGLVVYIPKPSSSVDQYYRLNPTLLLEQQPEEFAVDPSNPYIARKHINAAAYSLGGLSYAELDIFGSRTMETVQKALVDQAMFQSGPVFKGTYRNFGNRSDVYAISGIRSQAQIPYVVCTAGRGQCKLSMICLGTSDKKKCVSHVSTLDKQYAYRDCHPGAVYEGPDGTCYRISDIDEQTQTIHAQPMIEDTLERTFVEEDVSSHLIGEPKAGRRLPAGVELQMGEVQVTRSFTGYFTYELVPKSNCRRCRRDYDADVSTCPSCGRRTSRSYGQSKPKRHDFPEPYNETGFHMGLQTTACWLKIPAETETRLSMASPCKLPGEQNAVAAFLKRPFQAEQLVRLSVEEQNQVGAYHEYVGSSLRQRKYSSQETVLFPGVYGQCLLGSLRGHFPEGRSLEIFQAVTGYPVTDNLKHVCRNCQTSVLFQAMHTLEHTVLMRYPSIALGDISDLGSFTNRHPNTGMPTIFWYDNYDGGLGAAEKIFEKFQELLVASEKTLTSCSCRTLEGCPNCTHLGHCDRQNKALGKVGLLALIAVLQGRQPGAQYEPFVYRITERPRFTSAYKNNEYVRYEHGVGEETPQTSRTTDPYQLLRIQNEVHNPVLEKAYMVRGEEIAQEVPPVSEVDLQQAYQQILLACRPSAWNIKPGQDPYRVLEILPSASLPMIQSIYRVIARQVHPDTYQGNKTRANEMMKLVNQAFDMVKREKLNNHSNDDFE